MDYVVKDTDTLERIAASHDCTVGELVKLNKLRSRIVFAGQRLTVPSTALQGSTPPVEAVIGSADNARRDIFTTDTALTARGMDPKAEQQPPRLRTNNTEALPRRGPGGAVPIQPLPAQPIAPPVEPRRQANAMMNLEKTYSLPLGRGSIGETMGGLKDRQKSEELPTAVSAALIDDADKECLQRFLKIRVKQITESDGTVPGTLLVTPNCLMFDPDVDHPLVAEKGSDLYGMVANMDDIVSISMYCQFADVTGSEKARRESVHRPRPAIAGKDLGSKPAVAEPPICHEIPPPAALPKPRGSRPQPISLPQQQSEEMFERDKSATADYSLNGRVRFVGGASSMEDNEQLAYGTSAGTMFDDEHSSSFAAQMLQGRRTQAGDMSGERSRNAAAILDPQLTPGLPPGSPKQTTTLKSLSGSDQQLPSIVEDERERRDSPTEAANAIFNAEASGVGKRNVPSAGQAAEPKRRTVSDLSSDRQVCQNAENSRLQQLRSCPKQNSSLPDEQQLKTHSERLDSGDSSGADSTSGLSAPGGSSPCRRRSPSPSSPLARYSPMAARRSFGKLGRTLSARASSIKESVASGAQQVATGTQKVAHGVVTHTRSAADHIQTGIQTSAKVVAAMPANLRNASQELLQEGQAGMMEAYDQLLGALSEGAQPPMTPKAMKREKSLATLESLKQKTQQAREQSLANLMHFSTACEELPAEVAFRHSSELPPTPTTREGTEQQRRELIGTPPDPPFYMTVRVDRRRGKRKSRLSPANPDRESFTSIDLPSPRHSSFSSTSQQRRSFLEEEPHFGNRRKREFWFAVPCQRVDTIYHFLLHWSPEKYGQEEASTADETNIVTSQLPTAYGPPMDTGEVGGDQSASADMDGGPRNRAESEGGKKRSGASVTSRSKAIVGSGKGFVVLDSDVDDALAGIIQPSFEVKSKFNLRGGQIHCIFGSDCLPSSPI